MSTTDQDPSQEDLTPEELAARQKAADAAFVRDGQYPSVAGGGYKFKLTPRRFALAFEMGLRWSLFLDEDLVEVSATDPKTKQRRKIEMYRQFYRDVIIVAFVTSLDTPDLVEVEKDPSGAKDRMYDWAEAAGLGAQTEAYTEAAANFFLAIQDLKTADGKQVHRAPSGSPADPAPKN